jgi:predicted nucleic acid-binding protein
LELMVGPEQLYAPELIRLEVLAAFTRRVRREESTVEEARSRRQDWLRHLHEGVVALIPESEVLQDATELSLQVRHPLQDCLYLAVALRFNAPLVTADKSFQERAAGVYAGVSLLRGCDTH